jgi:hypothetical protein
MTDIKELHTYIVWMYIQSACRHVETKKAKIIGVITAYMP